MCFVTNYILNFILTAKLYLPLEKKDIDHLLQRRGWAESVNSGTHHLEALGG